MIVDFQNISDESRLWLYASELELNKSQINYISKEITNFLMEWKYHGQELESSFVILEKRFVIIALDDSESGVGGCSVDSLQHIIQKIEMVQKVTLLNRLNIYCKIDNEIKCIPISKLTEIAKSETLFFDLTIQRKFEISSYLKPISEGWCSYLIK